MKRFKLVAAVCLALMLGACSHDGGGNGAEAYVGSWTGVKGFNSANLKLAITRNDANYVVDDGLSKMNATIKDGSLSVSTPGGNQTLAIDKATGHVLFAGDEFSRTSK